MLASSTLEVPELGNILMTLGAPEGPIAVALGHNLVVVIGTGEYEVAVGAVAVCEQIAVAMAVMTWALLSHPRSAFM
jgi:hypothetical protein